MGKTFADTTGNRNGMVLKDNVDFTKHIEVLGMPHQMQTMDLPRNTSEVMKRGAEPQIFDNNGGFSKADGAGVINKNGEYGNLTYGF